MENRDLRGSHSPIDVFKYRRRLPSPIAPQTAEVDGSYGSKGQKCEQGLGCWVCCTKLDYMSLYMEKKICIQISPLITNLRHSCASLQAAQDYAHPAQSPTLSAVTKAAALTSSPKPSKTSETPNNVISCKDWSPEDAGIAVILSPTEIPSSKEDVDASSTALPSVVYGLTARRRLPLFAEICPE